MRITRTLPRGSRGTARLRQQYGEAMLCVRYRVDESRQKRYKTVELIVEEMPYLPPNRWRWMHEEVLIQVGRGEQALQRRLKTAGAHWHPDVQFWSLPRYVALQLGVEKRIRKRPAERVHP